MAPPTDLDETTQDSSVDEARRPSRSQSRKASRFGLWAVLLAPILVNLPAIVRIVKYEPEARTSGIATIEKVGFLPGQAFLDPNVGFNSQALGHAAAVAWLHGHVPWWNLNAGIGLPLAGSIQSASFFPPVLLQALPVGSMWFHIAIELLIGIATYALLRELRCSPLAAAVGAIAFELNGSISWLTNAPANPVAFLPLCILGVEYVVNAAGARRRGGWVLLALGVWLSIVSGFPEVAVLNSLLVACWFVVRVAQRPRIAGQAAMRAALGVVVGLLLAAPVLNAFVRYLHVANLGLHNQALSPLSIPRAGLAQLVSPYFFGGIFDSTDPTITEVWSRVGGYTGVMLLVLACGALWGARDRLIRFMLAGWAILFFGAAYNVPVLHQIVQHIPGMLHIAVYRYSAASSLFCLCVLAAFCIDDLRGLGARALSFRLLPGLALACALFVIGYLSAPGGRAFTKQFLPKWYAGSLVLIAGAVLAVGVVILLSTTKWRRAVPVVLAVLLAGEAMGFFLVPIVTFPREVTYDTQVVHYLQDNLGTQRFFSVGPLSPNWGSYYDVASLDAADLPIPKNWASFVHSNLNSCEFPWQFGNGGTHGLACAQPLPEMLENLPTYEALGVKYLLLPAASHLERYFQPRGAGGAATVDGGAHILLSWRSPSYPVGTTITALTLAMPGGVPVGLKVTACSLADCVTARPQQLTAAGEQFALTTPLTLGKVLTVHLAANDTRPVQIVTIPSSPLAPAKVVADGVVLAGRVALATFSYDPTTLPVLIERTKAAAIYQLAGTQPIATAPGCTVADHSATSFTTTCTSASILDYRQLSFPGWQATVNGAVVPIATVENVIQEIAVPKGTASVSFTYAPPKSVYAWLAALLGVLAIAASLVWRRMASPAPRPARSAGATPSGEDGSEPEASPQLTADAGAARRAEEAATEA